MVSPSPSSRFARWLLLIIAIALAGGLYAVRSGAIEVPERFNPWAPLDVAAPPGPLTGYKLSRARGDPALCLAALAQTGMAWDLLPDRTTGTGCGFENAVRLRSAAVRFGPPLPLSCPMALSFAMWERHALQPAAAAAFGQPVVAIDHLGSYACRDINRGEGATAGSAGSRSRHATANALDIAALTLKDGTRINVRRDWLPEDTREARLLRALHDGACEWFDGVLGPDYNAVHRDHFHLETGGYSMCR